METTFEASSTEAILRLLQHNFTKVDGPGLNNATTQVWYRVWAGGHPERVRPPVVIIFDERLLGEGNVDLPQFTLLALKKAKGYLNASLDGSREEREIVVSEHGVDFLKALH